MFEKGRKMVVFGDMNGRIGNSELAGVVRKWGVEGVNKNGEHLVDVSAERGLFLANTFFCIYKTDCVCVCMFAMHA